VTVPVRWRARSCTKRPGRTGQKTGGRSTSGDPVRFLQYRGSYSLAVAMGFLVALKVDGGQMHGRGAGQERFLCPPWRWMNSSTTRMASGLASSATAPERYGSCCCAKTARYPRRVAAAEVSAVRSRGIESLYYPWLRGRGLECGREGLSEA
jgi:hypothetical protein